MPIGIIRSVLGRETQVAVHAANVLPELVGKLKAMQDALPQNPKSPLLWAWKDIVREALELAEEVKP